MQVAISVVAAAAWMIANPERGVCVPDDLPHEEILKACQPYLGQLISTPSDWTPWSTTSISSRVSTAP